MHNTFDDTDVQAQGQASQLRNEVEGRPDQSVASVSVALLILS